MPYRPTLKLSGDLTHIRARKVITRSGTIVRGKFPSRKNGRMVHHEGLLELDACYFFELAPSVVEYREQPRKMDYPDGTRVRSYTPDFLLTLRSGEELVIEIKHSEVLARPDVEDKYNKIASHLQRQGTAYVIITERLLRDQPRLRNLKKMCGALTFPRPSDALIANVISPLLKKSPLTISNLERYLEPRGLQAADLLASGYLHLDLNKDVCAETIVFLFKEPKDDWLRFC